MCPTDDMSQQELVSWKNEARSLRLQVKELRQEVKLWKNTVRSLESCLRGIQGFVSDDDGYEVNVSKLKLEIKSLQDQITKLKLEKEKLLEAGPLA